MGRSGSGLTGASSVPWRVASIPSEALRPVEVVSGPDPLGHGIQVAVADWSSTAAPSREALRTLHNDRVGKRAVSLIVAVWDGERAWLFGPNPEADSLELPLSQAQRILQAVLNEPDGLAARTRYAQAAAAVTSSRTAGVANQGLFATHYLATTAPKHPLWEAAHDRALPMLGLRHESLIKALGFTTERNAAHSMLLKSGDAARAVAVLLEPSEQFDTSATRFEVSPVAWGLRVAARAEVPWLLMLRGSQLRLYPAKPGVGVGQKSQADTWFEVDLALIDEDVSALLPLVFSADALAPGGTTQEFLDGSAQFAVELGERLRDRVYEQAVPRLATAVAGKLPMLGIAIDAVGLDIAYRLSLRILFRLLFQAYAEDRGLLPYGRNARYDRNALKTWASDLSENPDQPFDADSSAIWDDLTQVWRVIDSGDSAWNVPAYNGGLFGSDPQLHPEGALLEKLRLGNDTMGPVLAALLVDQTAEGGVGAVDFRSLSVREFGTIYEGLLESALSITPIPLAAGVVKQKGKIREVYVPATPGDDVLVPAGGVYFHSKSGERKATGTYFTPHIVVEHLLERALEPVIADHLERVQASLDAGDEAAAAEEFFDLRVADLAMGSAHFLTAAIDRIEARMRDFLTEHPIPAITNELRALERAAIAALGEDASALEIEPAALLRRQIARRCIYGLDINPMAVELARLAIWISTFVPGLPMSSLDHTLVCGNSLTGVGTIDEALATLDPTPGTEQISTLSSAITDELAHAKVLLVDVANTSEATKADVTANAHAAAQARVESERARLLFDAVVAARLGLLTPDQHAEAESLIGKASQPDIAGAVAEVNPAHLPYLFPEVFLRDESGFDAVVGNPPWEKVRYEAAPFWAGVEPGLMALADEKRNRRIGELRAENPAEASRERVEIGNREQLQKYFLRTYQLRGGTHLESAQLMLERALACTRSSGRLGLVLPRQSMVLAGWKNLRAHLLADRHLDVMQVRNKGGEIFKGVHASYMVVFLVVNPANGEGSVEVAAASSRDEFLMARDEPGVRFDRADLEALSDTYVVPWFNTPRERSVFEKFRDGDRLGAVDGWVRGTYDSRWDFTGSGRDRDLRDPKGDWAVLMTAHVRPFELDMAKPIQQHVSSDGLRTRASRGLSLDTQRRLYLDDRHPLIVIRRPSRSDDTRTLMAAALPARGFLPNNGSVHGISCQEVDLDTQLALLGLLNTFVMDWWVRRFVDRHVTAPVINNLPIPNWSKDQRSFAAALVSGLLRRTIEDLAGGGSLSAVRPCVDVVAAEVQLNELAAAGYGLTTDDLATMVEDFSLKAVSAEVRRALGLPVTSAR